MKRSDLKVFHLTAMGKLFGYIDPDDLIRDADVPLVEFLTRAKDQTILNIAEDIGVGTRDMKAAVDRRSARIAGAMMVASSNRLGRMRLVARAQDVSLIDLPPETAASILQLYVDEVHAIPNCLDAECVEISAARAVVQKDIIEAIEEMLNIGSEQT